MKKIAKLFLNAASIQQEPIAELDSSYIGEVVEDKHITIHHNDQTITFTKRNTGMYVKQGERAEKGNVVVICEVDDPIPQQAEESKPKKFSKMGLCLELYEEALAKGPEYSKWSAMTKAFQDHPQLQMSKAAANTYLGLVRERHNNNQSQK